MFCHPFDDGIADLAASIRADLSVAGNLIGQYDLQIAATAVERGLTLVNHNIGEFSRVPNLKIEDWES
jgi:tRNA(fMet)-specific endonuclease VapC